MKRFPEETKKLAQIPLFEFGNHTYQHIHPAQVPSEILRNEIRRTDAIFYRLTGKQMSPLYRPPFGEYDASSRQTVAHCGFQTVHWSVESGDPDRNQSADGILSECLKAARPGGVVLLHMNGYGWHTPEALPRLIRALKQRGYVFVKVSDL